MPPNGKTILISGGLVYDDDGNTNHPARADISIVGDTIASVDPCEGDELRPHLHEALRRTWGASLEVNRYVSS
jgi:hypothetical protein